MSDQTQRFAPDGKIWACRACGKRAKDRQGVEGQNDQGWDESCMLNSSLEDDWDEHGDFAEDMDEES